MKMRKKLLSLLILLLFIISALNMNTMVSAGEYPAIYIDPATTVDPTLTPGKNYTISIKTDYNGSNVWGWQFSLTYNPSVLDGTEVTNGDLITTDVSPFADFIPGTFNNTLGKLSKTTAYFWFLFPPPVLTSGPGTLANVTFTVVGEGASDITLGIDTWLVGRHGGPDYTMYNIIDAESDPDHIQHGYFQNSATVTHDIAVTSITPSDTTLIVDDSVDIMVNVANEGNINEAFNVAAYANASVIETKTVTNLGSGLTRTLTFIWDTTGWQLGTYAINATASTVPDETETDDNTLVSGQTITVTGALYLPIADIVVEETVIFANVSLVFKGGSSYDPDGGTITAFFWDFDDGTNATGGSVLHEFAYLGFYDVSLVVTDSQGNVSDPCIVTIEVEDYPSVPPDYAADLVKWKARPEARSWDESWDDDGLVTLTALALNQGTYDVNVTVSYTIIDYKTGGSAGPVITEDRTLNATGLQVEITTELNPYDYLYTGEKLELTAEITLTYDSTGDGTPDTEGSTKTFRLTVKP